MIGHTQGDAAWHRDQWEKSCKYCRAYFPHYSCGKNRGGECDCPKCQGLCECGCSGDCNQGRECDCLASSSGKSVELVSRLREYEKERYTIDTWLLKNAADEIERLTAERDMLVEALDFLLSAINDKYTQLNQGFIISGPAVERAKEAISKIKGG